MIGLVNAQSAAALLASGALSLVSGDDWAEMRADSLSRHPQEQALIFHPLADERLRPGPRVATHPLDGMPILVPDLSQYSTPNVTPPKLDPMPNLIPPNLGPTPRVNPPLDQSNLSAAEQVRRMEAAIDSLTAANANPGSLPPNSR